MKKTRKYLAVILALVLLMSTMSPFGFADDVSAKLKAAVEQTEEPAAEEPAAEAEEPVVEAEPATEESAVETVEETPAEGETPTEDETPTDEGKEDESSEPKQADYYSVTVVAKDKTYTGTAYRPSQLVSLMIVPSVGADGTFSYEVVCEDENGNDVEILNAGEYEVKVIVTCSDGSTIEKVETVTIEKAAVADYELVIEQAADEFTYTGSEQTLAVVNLDASNLPEGAVIEWTNNEQTNAGTYTVTAAAVSQNYADVTASIDVEIKKADLKNEDLVVSALNPIYDGTAQQLVTAEVKGVTVDVNYDYIGNSATNAGEYKVTVCATVSGDNNYNDNELTQKDVPASILPATPATPTVEANTLTYNGDEQTLGTLTAPVVAESDIVGKTYYVEGKEASAFAATNAGSYSIYAVVTYGPNYGNAVLTTEAKTATIAKKDASIVYEVETKPVFFGIETKVLKSSGLEGIVDGDDVTLEYSTDGGTTWSSKVPTGFKANAYNISIKAVGNDVGNYNIDPNPVEDITVKVEKNPDAKIVATAATDLIYNGTAQDLLSGAASVTGMVDNDAEKVAFQYSLDGNTWSDKIPTATNVGTYTVHVKVVNAEGQDVVDNYDIDNLTVTVEIAKKDLTVTANTASFTYDGTAKTVADANGDETVAAGLVETPVHTYAAEFNYYLNGEVVDEPTNAGSYEVRVESVTVSDETGADVTANYNITMVDGTLTINVANVTITPVEGQWKYYMQADDADLATNYDVVVEDEVMDAADAKAELVSNGFKVERETGENGETGENVGTYVISPVATAYDAVANYNVTFTKGVVYTINRLPVTIVPNEKLGKNYGVEDENELTTIQQNFTLSWSEDADKRPVESDKFNETIALNEIKVESFSREAGEGVGTYEFLFDDNKPDGDAAIDYGNYSVTFLSEGKNFEISNVVVMTLADIDTRTEMFSYELANTDGAEMTQPVEVTINVDDSTATKTYMVDENVAKKVYVDSNRTTNNTVAIDGQQYVITPAEGEKALSEDLSWNAWLPVNTTVTMTATGLDREGNPCALVIDNGAASIVKTVAAKEQSVSIGVEAAMYTQDNGTVLEKAAGKVVISSASNTAEVITIVVNGTTYYHKVGKNDSVSVFPAEIGITSSAIPTAVTAVTADYADKTHLKSDAKSVSVAVDDAAMNGASITYENRGETLTFTLPELTAVDNEFGTAGEGKTDIIVTIDGKYTITVPAVAGQTEYTVDFSEWKNAPTLFTTSTELKVTYYDRAGYQGTLTAHPTQSDAGLTASIYIEPKPVEDTVGRESGLKLQLYGNAVEYEDLIITIAGRSYTVTASGKGGYEHTGKGQWSLTVNLEDIDFPVGVPTRITIAYANLNGGESSVELTYKDWCLPTLVTSPVAEGVNFIYGFAEPGSTIYVNYNGKTYASHTKNEQGETVVDSHYEVDQFGYWIFYLDPEDGRMALGDEITVQYVDFVGNKSEVYTLVVPEIFDGNTMAQPLGANIVDRLFDEEKEEWFADHRFATPVEIDKLREAAEDEDPETEPVMELPILSYTGYEIGTMTITLDNDELLLDYEIEESCLYEGAEYTLRFYESKPDLETLLTDETPSADIEKPVSIEPYGDVVWVYAEFDVCMPEALVLRRNGLKILTEQSMDEELYEMYQRFQVIE